MPGTSGGQKRSDPQELKLWMVMGSHMDTGNQIQVNCKNSQWSLPRRRFSALSSPFLLILKVDKGKHIYLSHVHYHNNDFFLSAKVSHNFVGLKCFLKFIRNKEYAILTIFNCTIKKC